MVERHGFVFLGEVGESAFAKECILDNYYHIKHRCGIIRTERMIEQLRKLETLVDSAGRAEQVDAILMEKWQYLHDALYGAL